MPETVYATTRNGWRHIYHTDPECQYLQRAEHRIQERDRDSLGEEWSPCKHCTEGSQSGQQDPGWDHYRDLVAAAGEEDDQLVTDGGRPTELPDLEKLHIDEVRRIWQELAEATNYGFGTEKMREWRYEAWKEIEDRVDPDYPECPKCGSTSWGQNAGEPKHCGGCGFEPGLQHMDLIEKIDQCWQQVRRCDDMEIRAQAKDLVPVDPEYQDELASDGGVIVTGGP